VYKYKKKTVPYYSSSLQQWSTTVNNSDDEGEKEETSKKEAAVNDVSSSSNDTEEDSSKYRCGVDNVGEKTNMEERTKQMVIDSGKRYTVARCDNNKMMRTNTQRIMLVRNPYKKQGTSLRMELYLCSTRMRRTV